MKQFCLITLVSILFFSCGKNTNLDSPVPAVAPTLTTTAATSITNASAASGGNISNDGGATITARGVCWSTATGPIITGNHTTDGTGGGIFTSNITGLTASTVYYVRAYATNSAGTSYGNEVTFTTTTIATALPTVTTTAITAIAAITATSGGNVTADGGATVTTRGICWSVTANPTIALSTKTSDGTGTGAFSSAITGLTAATIYHVRAYATNSVGTAYGADLTFTTASASGNKIKRVIQSVIGARRAYISTYTYDGAGRLLTFKEWEEDSTFTPVKITSSNYSAFTYNGANVFPAKNTITHEAAGSGSDSTIYTYDGSDRVTEEKTYFSGHVGVRNNYFYLTSTLMIVDRYLYTGTTLNYNGGDTLFFDAQQRITGSVTKNASGATTGYTTYTYDNKNNPFQLMDAFKHMFTLYCDDGKFMYRAPNNFTQFRQVQPTSGTAIDINYLTFNAGLYPVTATASIASTPGSTENSTMLFEYY